jgi:hypothetical protein
MLFQNSLRCSFIFAVILSTGRVIRVNLLGFPFLSKKLFDKNHCPLPTKSPILRFTILRKLIFEHLLQKAIKTMNKINLLLSLLLAFSLWTCDNDDDKSDTGGELTLNFRGLFDQNKLKMFNADYAYEDNMKLRLQLFQFYISDVALMKTDDPKGDSIQLIDVELVSFKNIQSDDAAQKGISFTLKNIPPGTYKGIKLGLGVSADLNAVGPSSYTPPHPLDDNYWSWAKGYVFTKIEGNADLDNSGKFANKITFHIGENEFFRKKVFLKDIVITDKGSSNLALDVDLHRVLAQSSANYLDFRKVTQDHTVDKTIAKFIADNLGEAIKVHQE